MNEAGGKETRTVEVDSGFDSAELLRLLRVSENAEQAQALWVELAQKRLNEQQLEDPPASEVQYQLLRFLVDDRRSRLQVQALADLKGDPPFDRDAKVLAIWRALMNDDPEFVGREHLSTEYHQRRLFAWFIDRYDLERARGIFLHSTAIRWTLTTFNLLACAVALLLANTRLWSSVLILAGYVLPAAIWLVMRHPIFEFIQSLVPRLAATALAGATLLLSAGDLLRYLQEHGSVCKSLVLLAFASGYLALEVQHRVYPRLRCRELVNRVAGVVVLSLSHSIAIVLLALPAIVALGNLKNPITRGQIFTIATAVFSAGLILNVLWAEEPITSPL